MSNAYRPNRKITDADLIRLNSVGLSLSTIAGILSCHPTTVTLRLKGLGVPPADTRRTFMEDIFLSLPLEQQDWVADQLGPHLSIKDFVTNLLVSKFIEQREGKQQCKTQSNPSSSGS